MGSEVLSERAAAFAKSFSELEEELGKVIVGNKEIIRLTLAALFTGGHVLLEGSPGLGKTLLVRSIAEALGLSFHRIQFTADLMPSDITGTQVLMEDESGRRSLVFRQGPIFSNIVLADEINRAGPKTQSALLEAMEEKQVSVLDKTYKLPQPFFVLATQNPIELEGTYPLPEAQLDRFVFKILVKSPNASELKQILTKTTGAETALISEVFSEGETGKKILEMRELVRSVLVAPPLLDVISGVIFALNPESDIRTNLVSQYVRFGPGPRAAQAILLGAKVFALLDNRLNVAYEDLQQVLNPALRHRLILNFQAEADSVSADDIIEEVKKVK